MAILPRECLTFGSSDGRTALSNGPPIFVPAERRLAVAGPKIGAGDAVLTDQKLRIRSVPMVKLLLLRPLSNGLAVEWS
jgi:hypothetical protein